MSQFKPGFRISLLDIAVLTVAAILAYVISSRSMILMTIVLFVVGHFFLFCNVIRISRISELIWAGVFVSMSTITEIAGIVSWYTTIGISLFVTFVLVILELRKESYHGVLWQEVNPNLPVWYEKNMAGSESVS
ncbi:hypothetical protein ACG1BZ_17295 [Microbulbifer sp. CNSA002]|uniref:hypothetical protein n=1 Tax=Microbulbifer sp. CNSA002 TaxID=3373604 RepID=UPI0039B5B814